MYKKSPFPLEFVSNKRKTENDETLRIFGATSAHVKLKLQKLRKCTEEV